jgi:hypothetical protein
MLDKAGYMQKAKSVTIDEYGLPIEVIELVIDGRRFGIHIDELLNAIRGTVSARTFKLRINWKQYVSETAGLAYLSQSRKAVNIELMDGNRYTVSLISLKSLLNRRSSYAPVAKLPISSIPRYNTIFNGSQRNLAQT